MRKLGLTIFSAITIFSTVSRATPICNCGTDGHETECCWEYDETNGKLIITGSGEMRDYTNYHYVNGKQRRNQPWEDKEITSVVISGITAIGGYAFEDFDINNVDIGNSVISIGECAFWGNNLKSVEIPDSVQSIRGEAFNENDITSIYIPESVKYLNGSNLFGTKLQEIIVSDKLNIEEADDDTFSNMENENLIIRCIGETDGCRDSLKQFIRSTQNYDDEDYEDDGYCDYDNTACLKADIMVEPIKEADCVMSSHYWSGTSCNNKKNGINCADNWKRNEDFCNRIRYTPAEAVAVLNDNNNTITITFKK